MEELRKQIEQALIDLGSINCTLRYEKDMNQIRLIRKISLGKTFLDNLIAISNKLDFLFVVTKVDGESNEILIYKN